MIVDMHCDTLCKIRNIRREGKNAFLRDTDQLDVNLQKMKKAGYSLQNFAIYIDLKETEDAFANAMELADIFDEEIEKNKDLISQVRTYGDMEVNRKNGKLSALLTLEEGGMCQGDIEKLHEFYKRGARMMTLCWNYENELGYGAACAKEHHGPLGLKKCGFDFLEEMESIGMIPDVSHLSDDGFKDVMRVCKKPFVASHSNARVLCGHPRNLTDEMLRQMGERGCIAGLNFYPEFLKEKGDSGVLLGKIAEHAAYMVSKGGSEVVGLGTDFDGFGGGSVPEDASRMELLADAFWKAGLDSEQIDKILYKNVLRLYREVLY